MKLKLFFLILFAATYQNCRSQDKASSENIKDIFYKEQNQLGQPIWQYLNSNFVSLHTLDEPYFTKKIDSLKSIYIKHLEGFKAKLTDETYEDETLGINAAFDKYLLEYSKHHNYITGDNVELTEGIQTRLNRNLQDFNKPSFLKNRDFRNYVKSYISIEAKKKLESGIYNGNDNQQLYADLAIIDYTFSNQEVNCFWKKEYLHNHIDNMGIKNIDSVFNKYLITCEASENTTELGDIYNAHKKERASHQIEIYKQVDGFNLEMHIFLPEKNILTGKRPTIVYFHGGSWSEGKPDWFFEAGEKYAENGWVAAAVEYRIKGRHGSYPFESVMDAKSAIRWLRENANQFNIDPNKIVATGNSAGGHLALTSALSDNWNEKSDDISINAKPNVAIVNSAVYDLTVENSKWIAENKAEKNIVEEISPNSLVKLSSTKFLLIHGENDRRCTYASAEYFYENMKALENSIELHKIEDANHFIWFGRYSSQVAKITRDYLDELKFE